MAHVLGSKKRRVFEVDGHLLKVTFSVTSLLQIWERILQNPLLHPVDGKGEIPFVLFRFFFFSWHVTKQTHESAACYAFKSFPDQNSNMLA